MRAARRNARGADAENGAAMSSAPWNGGRAATGCSSAHHGQCCSGCVMPPGSSGATRSSSPVVTGAALVDGDAAAPFIATTRVPCAEQTSVQVIGGTPPRASARRGPSATSTMATSTSHAVARCCAGAFVVRGRIRCSLRGEDGQLTSGVRVPCAAHLTRNKEHRTLVHLRAGRVLDIESNRVALTGPPRGGRLRQRQVNREGQALLGVQMQRRCRAQHQTG